MWERYGQRRGKTKSHSLYNKCLNFFLFFVCVLSCFAEVRSVFHIAVLFALCHILLASLKWSASTDTAPTCHPSPSPIESRRDGCHCGGCWRQHHPLWLVWGGHPQVCLFQRALPVRSSLWCLRHCPRNLALTLSPLTLTNTQPCHAECWLYVH